MVAESKPKNKTKQNKKKGGRGGVSPGLKSSARQWFNNNLTFFPRPLLPKALHSQCCRGLGAELATTGLWETFRLQILVSAFGKLQHLYNCLGFLWNIDSRPPLPPQTPKPVTVHIPTVKWEDVCMQPTLATKCFNH